MIALPKKEGRCGLCRYRGLDKPTAGPSGLYNLLVCQDCLDEEAEVERTRAAFDAIGREFARRRP